MSGDFDKLMSELKALQADQGEMTKALPADDGKDDANIQAAAADGGLDTNEGGAGEGAADEEGKGAAPMAKSFQLTLEDGTTIEAQDGAEMVKALGDRVTTSEANFAKAMGGALDLIKSMQTQISKLSGEGRGRKAVLSVVEKPAPGAGAAVMAKSMAPEGMTSDVFFAKAFDAQKLGRISSTDIAVAEASLNRGEAIPAGIVQRVMA